VIELPRHEVHPRYTDDVVDNGHENASGLVPGISGTDIAYQTGSRVKYNNYAIYETFTVVTNF
jgi:hypothetical protein